MGDLLQHSSHFSFVRLAYKEALVSVDVHSANDRLDAPDKRFLLSLQVREWIYAAEPSSTGLREGGLESPRSTPLRFSRLCSQLRSPIASVCLTLLHLLSIALSDPVHTLGQD